VFYFWVTPKTPLLHGKNQNVMHNMVSKWQGHTSVGSFNFQRLAL